MRIGAIALVAAVLLVPAAAAADEFHGNECRRTLKQLAHFHDVLSLAEERDNELWENATRQHIQRLRARLERRCPEHVKASIAAQAAEETKAFLQLAAKAAITFFTLGLAPGSF